MIKISSNVVANSNDERNFPHKLLIATTQILSFRKAFANNSSTQLQKRQSGGFLGKLFGALLKTGFPLIRIY